jgi:transposase
VLSESEVAAPPTLEATMSVDAPRPAQPAIRTDLGAIFVSMELSRKTWLITSLSPGGGEKMSKHLVPAGDVFGLLRRFAELRRKAAARTGRDFPVIVIQEAGLDGFWIHRVLQSEGIESHVVDAASILTSRRRRRAKTDRIDGETLVRTLMAFKRGEPRVCSMARAPTPQEEDRRRVCRERRTLVGERVTHVNRIKGLLFAQGVFGYEPLRKGRRERLEDLRTGDGQPLPMHLKAQIMRELDRLEVLLGQLKTVEAERDALLKPETDKATSPAAMLTRLKGIGPETAAVLWSEGLFRQFDNRRQVAAYAVAERFDRSRAGCVQGGQPAAEDNNGRAGLAMAAEPAYLGAQPVVPRAGPAPWRADAQDDHRRPGAQAPHRPVAVHHCRRRHRGGGDEGGAGDDLTPSART